LNARNNIVAVFSGDGPVRQLQRHFEAATDVEGHEIVLREVAEVTGEAVQRVVLRIDGPDDFVHRAGEFHGWFRKYGRAAWRPAPGVFQFAVRRLAQERDAREVRAEVIVDVLGNAGALAFDGLLALNGFQFAAHPRRETSQTMRATSATAPALSPDKTTTSARSAAAP